MLVRNALFAPYIVKQAQPYFHQTFIPCTDVESQTSDVVMFSWITAAFSMVSCHGHHQCIMICDGRPVNRHVTQLQ